MDRHELIHSVLSRPKMFSSDIETHRDLLMFLQGICCGLRPHGGANDLAEFGKFVQRKLSKSTAMPWMSDLLETYGNPPAVEICELLAGLYQTYAHFRKA